MQASKLDRERMEVEEKVDWHDHDMDNDSLKSWPSSEVSDRLDQLEEISYDCKVPDTSCLLKLRNVFPTAIKH